MTLKELFAASPLYAILDTEACAERPPLEVVEALWRGGVRVIQYRHKGSFDRWRWEQCCQLAARMRKLGGGFFVNDRADIAKLCGAHGVHLGQDDLPPEKARTFLGNAFWIGYSTHNLEQAEHALRQPIDYVAVGPVFPTATKLNPDPVVGLELVSKVRTLTDKPLVAIGGITIENARSVIEAGADAVAVIRDLLGTADVEARAREFLKALGPGKQQ